MSTPRLGEFERIEVLRRIFGAPTAEVSLGIGDDAAILLGELAWSIDEAVEGTHFRAETLSHEQIGFRATMAALSDLAAMGAAPLGVLSAIAMPPSADEQILFRIAAGQKRAAEIAGTSIIGGNLARSPTLSITTSVLGRGSPLLTRSGARPGDRLWVAGSLGLARCGFLASERSVDITPAATSAFAEPLALLAQGASAAASGATAMVDVSDGCLSDLTHLARASGVSFILEPASLLSPELTTAANMLGQDPLMCALFGGEDYALLATAPEGRSLPGFRLLGRSVAHVSGAAYVVVEGHDALPSGAGFDHFR